MRGDYRRKSSIT